MIPSTDIPKRIGAIYNRRPTTPWSEKEVKAYKQLIKTYDPVFAFFERDLELIERYYLAERKKGDKGIYRRDLLTLLNNWNGEVDRARERSARVKSSRGFIEKKKVNGEVESSEEDFKLAGIEAKKLIADLRQTLR